MFQKKKNQTTQQSVRVRRPNQTLNESFRRNNVVVSRRQKEIAKHQQSVTQRQLEKKRETASRKTRMRLIALAIFVVIAFLAMRSSITSVALGSNASTKLSASQQQDYENSILVRYKTHTLFGQAWLLDTDALSKDILTTYPEIEHVTFSTNTPLTKNLKAEIRFRRPVFTWKDVGGENQFVDKNGVLFSKNLDPSVSVAKLINIEDQSGVVLAAGSSVITSNLVQFVGTLHSKLGGVYGANVKVERVIIPKSTREVQIQISATPYVIKFNSTRNLEEQVGELQSLLAFLKANNITPSAYIDLRVPHKAFYK
jgi:hypothetical protein